MKHTKPKPSFTLQVGQSYKTANNKTVEIFEIKDNGATCNVHGYVITKKANGKIARTWNTWAEDGRNAFVWGWSNLDIVKQLIED